MMFDARFAAALAGGPDLQGRRLASLADRNSLAFRSNLNRSVFDIRDLTSPAQAQLVAKLVQRGVPVTLFATGNPENHSAFEALVANIAGSFKADSDGRDPDLSSLR